MHVGLNCVSPAATTRGKPTVLAYGSELGRCLDAMEAPHRGGWQDLFTLSPASIPV
jgi:hypothetical protein